MKRSRNTPLNSIKSDWCPRLEGKCMCQSACPLRSAAERARADAIEQDQLPRFSGPVEWRPSVFLDSELSAA